MSSGSPPTGRSTTTGARVRSLGRTLCLVAMRFARAGPPAPLASTIRGATESSRGRGARADDRVWKGDCSRRKPYVRVVAFLGPYRVPFFFGVLGLGNDCGRFEERTG